MVVEDISCALQWCVHDADGKMVLTGFCLWMFVDAKWEFEMKAVHIPGVENPIPDALSCWELGEEHRLRFREVTKGLVAKEINVYPGLLKFMHDW